MIQTSITFCDYIIVHHPTAFFSIRSSCAELLLSMNAAARLVRGTRKYDHGLSHLLHVDLHWLDVADRVKFKLGLTVHRCLITRRRTTLLTAIRSSPTSPVGGGYVQLIVAIWIVWIVDVPRYNRSILGRRSFSVAGPTVWNLLPDDLRDQGCTESTFKQSLKTYLFAQH